LIENLLAGGELDNATRSRIAETSQGNPLFVEEMLAMVRERGGDGEIHVPPTIHALLQARLDTLDTDERLVIERGSVEGEVFHRGAVAVLAPDPVRPALGTHLQKLVRKELIRAVAPSFPDDERFRFRHLLIRDAAYESLPKATRAELHERFGDWLAQHDLVEQDEILGYHLEQAHRYRAELDANDARLPDLAGRAAERLTGAGNGAMDRGDWAAARSLLRRARALLPPGDDRRALLAPVLAIVLQETGELEEATALASEARDAEDPIVRARGVIAEADVEVLGVVFGPDETRVRREEARDVLERAGDHLGLAQYWRTAGFDHWSQCRATEAKQAWERGLEHAVEAGAGWLEIELQRFVLNALVLGPTPVPEAIESARLVLESVRGSVLREAAAFRALGALFAMEGTVDEGRELIERARATWLEAGLLVSAAGQAMTHASIERRAGNRAVRERLLREGLEELERLADRFFFPTVAVLLAEALAERRGPEAEIAALCAAARERTLSEDLVNFVYLDGIEGLLCARRDQCDEAKRLARRCVETADGTDHFDVISFARLFAAETLALCDENDEAATLAEEAVAVHVAKGDVTGAALARSRVREIGLEVA
jgi:tetratricopeptide (TPR) repeat protein